MPMDRLSGQESPIKQAPSPSLAMAEAIPPTTKEGYKNYQATLKALDQKVIPHLAAKLDQARPGPALFGTEAEINWFADALVQGEDAEAMTRIHQLLAGEWSIEQIYLDLLSGTARRLGARWHEDSISFVDVTIAIGRLRGLMEELEPAFHELGEDHGYRHGRILIAPVSGEQHTLGARMVATFMSRAGWDVVYEGEPTAERFAELLANQTVDLIGFSIGSEARHKALVRDIQAIRACFNGVAQAPPILVGGPLITRRPKVAEECGADGFAMDAAHALIAAHGYLPALTSE